MDAFDQKLLDIFRAKGCDIDAEGKLVRVSNSVINTLSDEQIRYYNSKRKCESRFYQENRWVDDLRVACDALMHQADSHEFFRKIFWIRLHGVFSELKPDLSFWFENATYDELLQVVSHDSLLYYSLKKYQCVEAIHKCFRDDELIYADYMRQWNCHLVQDKYEVGWSKPGDPNGHVKDKRTISSIGRTFTIAEIDEAIRRVWHDNGCYDALGVLCVGQEPVIANNFAKRIRSILDPLIIVVGQKSLGEQ